MILENRGHIDSLCVHLYQSARFLTRAVRVVFYFRRKKLTYYESTGLEQVMEMNVCCAAKVKVQCAVTWARTNVKPSLAFKLEPVPLCLTQHSTCVPFFVWPVYKDATRKSCPDIGQTSYLRVEGLRLRGIPDGDDVI